MNVLFLFPNARGMSLPPPAIGLFTALLKREGHIVGLFDTSGYRIPGFEDETRSREDKYHYTYTPQIPPGSNVEKALKRLEEIKKLDVLEELAKKIQGFNPDLIAVSVTESTFLIGVYLIREMKKRFKDLPLNIFGGVFPTFAPALAMRFPEVDMVCVGEGEKVLVEICRRMQVGADLFSIPGVWLRRKGEIIKNRMVPALTSEELDELPPPDYGLFEDFRFYRLKSVALERENPIWNNNGVPWRMLPLETMRGCPYECGFCNSPSQNVLFSEEANSRFFRKSSVERIRKEIVNSIKNFGANYFHCWADTFLAWSMKEFEAFCEMYEEFKLPFWCQSRPETVAPDRDGHKKLRMLLDAGMHWMAFGLEHGNQDYRRQYVRRDYSNQLITDSLKVARELGVYYTLNNIAGFPLETRALAFDTIELNRLGIPEGYKRANCSCSTFVPFVGTPLRDLAVARGFMPADYICPSNSADSILNMPPPYLSREEIKGIGLTFTMYVKFPKSRWPEIEQAEKQTPEGAAIRKKLAGEYKERFEQGPETRIEAVERPNDSGLPKEEIPIM